MRKIYGNKEPGKEQARKKGKNNKYKPGSTHTKTKMF
jgi:hypothetical protein